MTKLTIFEPAMCCETGICGVDPDTVLITFTADIEWLRNQGLEVQRYNLAQEPSAFVADSTVKTEINRHGESCLPLLVLDGNVISRGNYPDRAQLQQLTGIKPAIQASDHPKTDNTQSGCGCNAGSSND